jgi:hypothetical protein
MAEMKMGAGRIYAVIYFQLLPGKEKLLQEIPGRINIINIAQ